MIRGFMLSFLAFCLWHTTGFAQEWKEEKGDHFIVYYVNAAAKPRDILWKAEHSYNKIAGDLGYARYSNFWQWENRAKIYVHPSKESFQTMTGQPAWSDGMASYLDKSIHTIEGTEGFLNTVLPHEITHLIFRDFVGLESQTPLWLDEGIAQWEEDDKRALALKIMPVLVRRAEGLTLSRLMSTDIRLETDTKKVQVFYIQAISVVDFLVQTYGSSRFTEFCRGLRDHKRFEEALKEAYAPMLQSLADLEERWSAAMLARSHETDMESYKVVFEGEKT